MDNNYHHHHVSRSPRHQEAPFEIEEEHASLLNATEGAKQNGTVVNRVRFLKASSPHLVFLNNSTHRNKNNKIFCTENSVTACLKHCLSCCNPYWWQRQKYCAMAVLFWLVVVYAYLVSMDVIVFETEAGGGRQSWKDKFSSKQNLKGPERGPHQGSFGRGTGTGGSSGRGGGNDSGSATSNSLLPLPRPTTLNGIPSISTENLHHHWEDYVHDPYRSPYASHLYEGLDVSEVDQEQIVYLEKQNIIHQRWGAWEGPTTTTTTTASSSNKNYNVNNKKKFPTVIPADILDGYANRDMPRSAFPKDSWQLDRSYVTSLLQQGHDLVDRVKEGIYAEYGHATVDHTNNKHKLSPHGIDQRNQLFRVITEDFEVSKLERGVAVEVNNPSIPKKGIAYLNEEGWKALIRKLLHAMVTNDVFYVVLVGPGSSYKGNNLWQSQAMQFNYLMEPIFDLLGMKLVTRHMGMDASTTISALGGGDIYGEADILWIYPSDISSSYNKKSPYDTNKNKKKKGEQLETAGQYDLLQKQAILSGERVPILLTPMAAGLLHDTNDTLWVGNIQPGAEVCPWTRRSHDGTGAASRSMPPACRYVRCDEDLLQDQYCSVHDSVCWVPRHDWTPPIQQEPNVGNQDSGYPGHNSHKWEGRKLSLLILHGIEAALEEWQKGMDHYGFPLMEKYWHVGHWYATARTSIGSLEQKKMANLQDTTTDDSNNNRVPPCEVLLAPLDPSICRTAMHSYTEWTPVVNPHQFQLRKIATNLILPPKPTKSRSAEPYHGVDLLAQQWKVPQDHVDVHMIAIATKVPPIQNDESTSPSSSTSQGQDGNSHHSFDFDDDEFWMEEDDDAVGAAPAASKSRGTGRKLVHRQEQITIPSRTPIETNISRIIQNLSSTSQYKPSESMTTALASNERRIVRSTNKNNENKNKGWTLVNAPVGFCDGSVQASLRCNRRIENSCLLSGYNFYRGSLEGKSNSGWLILHVDNIRNGILLARLEIVNHSSSSSSSSTVNEEDTAYEVDYAINGNKTTLAKDQFEQWGVKLARDLTVYPIMLPDHQEGDNEGERIHRKVLTYSNEGRTSSLLSQTVELKLRIRTNGPTVLRLSHLYYS